MFIRPHVFFVVYLTTLAVSSRLYRVGRYVGWWIKIWRDLEGSDRNVIEVLFRNLAAEREKTCGQTWVSKADVPAEIRIQYLPNTSQESHR
jgi:hypothetical protein